MYFLHKQVDIEINNNIIQVDKKLAYIIKYLNDLGFATLYSCQGDKYNEGYIKFDEKVDIETVYYILDELLPYHVLRLDFNNIIRFSRTRAAYLSQFEITKRIKRKKVKKVNTRSKKMKTIDYVVVEDFLKSNPEFNLYCETKEKTYEKVFTVETDISEIDCPYVIKSNENVITSNNVEDCCKYKVVK